MNFEDIKNIANACESNEDLALMLVSVKAAIKARKAEIKAAKTAEVKAFLSGEDVIGQLVTVKAPASTGAPVITGIITRVGDKSFTVETTAIATATGKPKKLARAFDLFVDFGDVTADFVSVVDEMTDEGEVADEMAV